MFRVVYLGFFSLFEIMPYSLCFREYSNASPRHPFPRHPAIPTVIFWFWGVSCMGEGGFFLFSFGLETGNMSVLLGLD